MPSKDSKTINLYNKIRKNWLIFSIIYFFVYPIFFFLILKIFSQDSRISNDLIIKALLIQEILSLIYWALLFNFAYKRNGNFLLTMDMVSSSKYLCNIWSLKITDGPLKIVLLVFSFLLLVLWLTFSYKLTKVNKKIRIRNSDNPEYFNSLQNMKSLNSNEELMDSFHQLIQKWPNFERVTSEEYKLKLEELQNS